jgi:tRNA A37 threonylcarbamoyladenosine synthetase subunit TsaC/SUA5/YrdC
MLSLRTFRSANRQSSDTKARCAREVVIRELLDRQGDPVAVTVTETATDEVLHRAVGLREAFDWIAAAALRERRAYNVRATVLDLDSEGLGSRARIATTSR